MYKHFFFDLDKTLTKSRSPMDAAHRPVFRKLCESRDVAIMSGGSREQIREQTTAEFDGMYYALGQSGNHAVGKDGVELWNDILTTSQVDATLTFIELLEQHFAIDVKDVDDLIENRGAQISYSVIGFHEDTEKKYAFDPDDSRRAAALKQMASAVTVLNDAGVEVVPAGTTTYNFMALGRHKGFNVRRFIERMQWNAAECIYIGDALFPGGNDSSVIGVIPTHAVETPDDTFTFINQMLS